MMAFVISTVARSWKIVYGVLMMLWCVHYSSCSSTLSSYDYINETVQAVEGDVAKLYCNTAVTPNDSVTLIMWFQYNHKDPICSLDKRKKSYNKYTNAEWASTSTLQLTENEDFAILTLRPVKSNHSGLYRCRVDFKNSPTRSYVVNVTLIVPPQKLIISDNKNDELRNNHIGPYRENETVIIYCSAIGGSPPPRVTWFQGGSLLFDHTHSERMKDGSVQNSLKLRLTRDHLNAVYTCQASNNNITSLITPVTINMTLSPQSVKLEGADKMMSAGRLYEISCYVYGAHPSPVIRWSKANEKLKNYRKSDSNDGNLTTTSRLSFSPHREDDGKDLSCSVDLTPTRSISDSQKLNISYVPIVTAELGGNLNASAVIEGSDVYFDCKYKSNLNALKTTWKQDGKLMRHNLSAGVLTQKSLVLQKVSRRQSGTYSCVVSNAEGDGESDGVYLDVKFAPVCNTTSTIEYGADRGEKVRVLCEVEANPSLVTFAWEFSSTKTGSSSTPREFTTEETRSYIEFQPNSENDYGMLYCKANNSVGQQQQPCVFRIIPVGKPDAMSNCAVTNRTSNTLMIKCVAGFDGGSRQRFVVEVYRQKIEKLVHNLSNDSPEFSIVGLQTNVAYNFVMYALNAKGRSQTIEFNETLHSDNDVSSNFSSPASELSPMLKLPPLLLILAALVILLILLSCCIVIVIRSQEGRRRKKHYVYKSKESLEKNPDIIPNKDDVSCTFEITTLGEEKQHPSKHHQTDISLILQNSYGTDMNSDFVLHQDEYKCKMFGMKTSSLRKLNECEITYASCDQPCPPFVTQETPLLSSTRVPFIVEGQHAVQCCIHGLSRSTSIS